MDNLTHTLVGAALGEAGLRRRTPRALLTLLIGANLPDLDILSSFTGTSLAFRRGWTHGILAMIVLPFLLAGLVLAGDRLVAWGRGAGSVRADGRQVLLLAAIAVWTHPLLDWLNVYGARLLMPFSGRWFYGDSLVIVDPWLWGVLALGVSGSVLLRTGGRSPARSHRPARAALGGAAVYIAGMIALTSLGRWVVKQELHLARIPSHRALMVAPVFGVPWRRDVTLAVGERYWFGRVHWRPRPRLDLSGTFMERGFDEPRLRYITPNAGSRSFLVWARFPYYVVEGQGRTRVVRLDDARYGTGRRTWAAVIFPLESPR